MAERSIAPVLKTGGLSWSREFESHLLRKEMKYIFNRYFNYYINFLILEIPNILQILTLVGFFSLLIKNDIMYFLLILFLSTLFSQYLNAKFFEYIKKDTTNYLSVFERNNFNIGEYKHFKYVFITTILFQIIICFILRQLIKHQ